MVARYEGLGNDRIAVATESRSGEVAGEVVVSPVWSPEGLFVAVSALSI